MEAPAAGGDGRAGGTTAAEGANRPPAARHVRSAWSVRPVQSSGANDGSGTGLAGAGKGTEAPVFAVAGATAGDFETGALGAERAGGGLPRAEASMHRTSSCPVRFSQMSYSAAEAGVMLHSIRRSAATGAKIVRRIGVMLCILKIRARRPL